LPLCLGQGVRGGQGALPFAEQKTPKPFAPPGQSPFCLGSASAKCGEQKTPANHILPLRKANKKNTKIEKKLKKNKKMERKKKKFFLSIEKRKSYISIILPYEVAL
jgi:hypothetical protein